MDAETPETDAEAFADYDSFEARLDGMTDKCREMERKNAKLRETLREACDILLMKPLSGATDVVIEVAISDANEAKADEWQALLKS